MDGREASKMRVLGFWDSDLGSFLSGTLLPLLFWGSLVKTEY